MRILPLTLFLLGSFFQLHSQVGGNSAFQFLSQPVSARVNGLGGMAFSNPDQDVNFGFLNPALLNSALDGNMSLNGATLPDGIRFAEGMYSKHYKNIGSFLLGFRYLDYGSFVKSNVNGQNIGSFRAAESMFQIGYGYALDTNWSIGANQKIINSGYASFSSWALAWDFSVNYSLPESGWTFALLARNAGFQLSTFDGTREKLPFSLDFSLYKKFSKAPFSWYVTYEHLQQFDLYYADPNAVETDPLTGEEVVIDPSFFNRFMRHITLGGELKIGKALNIQVGYRFRKNYEMSIPTRRSSAGLTFGAGVKVSKFRINYGNVNMNLAGRMHTLSIVTSLDEFSSKK